MTREFRIHEGRGGLMGLARWLIELTKAVRPKPEVQPVEVQEDGDGVRG